MYNDLSQLKPLQDANLTLPNLARNVRQGINFIFTKQGDGEQECLNGVPGGNCDGQNYSPELRETLAGSYRILANLRTGYDRVYVVVWGQRFTVLHQVTNEPREVKDFWASVIESPRRKIFVGPARLNQVAKFLRSDFIAVPEQRAFDAYRLVLNSLHDHWCQDAIYVYSAGLASKCWIAAMASTQITAIDAGSAFDPLFVGTTRTMQWTREDLLNLYADYL